ncbi:MAG: DUF2793 domain-containing protein [Proteobacteria bacterium]|nr:DUF2793 domain-containing protein [Pseudomonadota bacterium]
MTDTIHLGLPYIDAAQAQKHVTHNEALRTLDALVMLTVLDRDLSAPPASPAAGSRYIVKAAGSGAFAGKSNQIAHFADGAWWFHPPQVGWTCYVTDEMALLAWDGTSWVAAVNVLGIGEIANLGRLGLGTSADATNPFSAKLNNALWVAKTAAEGGDGNLRYKMSKESATKTLSLLMQDNFSGRAEVGLTGDDDFHFKVSPDRTTWYEGIVINSASGAVSFPNTTIAGGREVLVAARTYYVRTDGNDANSGLANTSGGAFATIQKAIDTVASLDVSIYTVTIQVGNGTYTGANVLKAAIGSGTIIIQGDTATPSNVVISTTAANCFTGDSVRMTYRLQGLKLQSTTSGYGIAASGAATYLEISALNFGASASAHVFVSGAYVVAVGNYTISGSATDHVIAFFGGKFIVSGLTVTLSGTPAFATSFARAIELGAIRLLSNVYSGSATGKRFDVSMNSTLQAGGATLPGSIAGTTSTGGQAT